MSCTPAACEGSRLRIAARPLSPTPTAAETRRSISPGNEFCERLAYYGIQTNMGLYLKKYMGYSASEATQLVSSGAGSRAGKGMQRCMRPASHAAAPAAVPRCSALA